MQQGFVKVAAGTPDIKVAEVEFNVSKIIEIMDKASRQKVKLLVLPELCVTGYTCSDLFFQKKLLDEAESALLKIEEASSKFEMVTIVGVPLRLNGDLYNCGAVIYKGDILGIIPKSNIPVHNEFYEKRYFREAFDGSTTIEVNGKEYLFGVNNLFICNDMREFCFAVEICEDLWAPQSPSIKHSLAGANIIANLSASNQIVGKSEYRRILIGGHSAKCVCGYIYANAGEGESTTDLVFTGHNMIYENGILLSEDNSFKNNLIISEIDVERLASERRKLSSFRSEGQENYNKVYFEMQTHETKLTREFSKNPFVPNDEEEKEQICDEILLIQSLGLKKRITQSRCQKLIVGISGGIDSCLALIVSVKAIELLDRPHTDVLAITMPCFGTSEKTHNSAIGLAKGLGVTLKEIDITETMLSHFKDIEQDENCYDITFENGQARERTQVLMDIANKTKGIVVGTGDLSELALGWATYNGDHMSMYSVNSSIPKTLIRHIIKCFAEKESNRELKEVLINILETPVSPELLPGSALDQKTEDIVGPYELHDFFLYYSLRWGFEPSKILRIAEYAFGGDYDRATILKWLKIFYKRFFTYQFKRSCLPDGPKVGSVAISPRGDLRMPSDACVELWLRDLE